MTTLTFLPSIVFISKLSFGSYEYFFMVAFLLSFLSYGPFPLHLLLSQCKSCYLVGSCLLCFLTVKVVGIIIIIIVVVVIVIWNTHCVPGSILSTLYTQIHLILIIILWGQCFWLHLITKRADLERLNNLTFNLVYSVASNKPCISYT